MTPEQLEALVQETAGHALAASALAQLVTYHLYTGALPSKRAAMRGGIAQVIRAHAAGGSGNRQAAVQLQVILDGLNNVEKSIAPNLIAPIDPTNRS